MISKVGVAWSLDLTLFYLVMQKKIRPCRRKVIPSGGSTSSYLSTLLLLLASTSTTDSSTDSLSESSSSTSTSRYYLLLYMKDYIDVSNQENVAPVYFQSLSLD